MSQVIVTRRAGLMALLLVTGGGCELVVRIDPAREREADAARCNDGVDNDGNGKRDCEEPGCEPFCACKPTEIACNGRDDDCDGRVDEVDWGEGFEADDPAFSLEQGFRRARVDSGARDGAWVLGLAGDCPPVAGKATLGGVPGGLQIRLFHRVTATAVSGTRRLTLLAADGTTVIDRFETASAEPHGWQEVILDGRSRAGETLKLVLEGSISRCPGGSHVDNEWQIDAVSGRCGRRGVIVYASDEGHPNTTTIRSVNDDGTGAREVSPAPGQYPRLAPGGDTVYFVDEDHHLLRAPIGGGAVTTLAGDAYDAPVGCAPDGGRLAYSALVPVCPATRVRIIDALDGSPLADAFDSNVPDSFVGPDWSVRDRLAVNRGCGQATMIHPVVDLYSVFTFRPDGSERMAVTGTPTFEAGHPRFSPDGTQVMYEVGSGPLRTDHSIEAIAVEAGTARRLYQPPSGTKTLGGGWSPDGDRVVFSRCTGDAPCELWKVRTDGSEAALFLSPAAGSQRGLLWPDWSAAPPP